MGDFIEMRGTVFVYSIPNCARCLKAKRILSQRRIQYTDISLDSFPQAHAEMVERAGGDPTVPQIFFNSIHVGNAEDLEEIVHDQRSWEALLDIVRLEEPLDGPPLPSPNQAIDVIDENANGGVPNDVFLWIPDEYTKIVSDMKKANIIKDNRVGLIKQYKNSFKGQDFIDWIMKERGIKRPEALELGQELIDKHFGQQTSKERGETFSPDRYYQLIEDDENKPLNVALAGADPDAAINAAECNRRLVQLITPIYEQIVSGDGQTIYYYRLVENEHFNKYLAFVRDLARVDLTSSTADERLALLINVYNMMTIHITQRFGPPVGVWARRKMFNSTYYVIGGHNYSLNSIFNGILRGNRKGNGYLWRPFGKQDLRLPLVIEGGEPLAFFGLNNGSKHSPPLRAYTVDSVRDELLEQVQKVLHCDEHMRIDTKKNVIWLTKIFKWHAEDFGNSQEKIVEWIVEALQDVETERANTVSKMFYTGEYAIEYLHYDWTFNGIERKHNRHKPHASKCALEIAQGGLAPLQNFANAKLNVAREYDFGCSYKM